MPAAEHVSVIIPARNAASSLADCLEALRTQTFAHDRYEVIVVDDGSTDSTAAVAERHGARVVTIAPSGPAAARNRGVEESRGDLLLFTDADCTPRPDWIERLVAPFDDPTVEAAKGVYTSEQSSWTARFVQAEYESRYRIMARRVEIDFIDTYCAAYRRRTFEAVGGFDASFPCPSVEDQELSFRLARRGARMVFCPDAVVSHLHAAAPLAYFRKKMKIGYWKTRVIGRYPEKALRDSHTPWSLKSEVLLVGSAPLLVVLALACGLPWLPALPAAGFLASGAPFCTRLLRADASLAWRAPFFLFVRALALAIGMGRGVLAGQFRRAGSPTRETTAVTREDHVGHNA